MIASQWRWLLPQDLFSYCFARQPNRYYIRSAEGGKITAGRFVAVYWRAVRGQNPTVAAHNTTTSFGENGVREGTVRPVFCLSRKMRFFSQTKPIQFCEKKPTFEVVGYPAASCFSIIATLTTSQSFSFVRRLPCGAGVKNFDVARWAGVGQSSMEETAGDTAAVGEA